VVLRPFKSVFGNERSKNERIELGFFWLIHGVKSMSSDNALKQSLCLNPQELNQLYGLPHVAQLLYLAIRRQMNYADGLVGNKYPISWLELAQALWVEPHRGRKNTGRPEIPALRKTSELLVKAGLITFHSNVKAKRLIFKCELATSDAPKTKPLDTDEKENETLKALKAQNQQLTEENLKLKEQLGKPAQPKSDPPPSNGDTPAFVKPKSPSKPSSLPTDADQALVERLFEIKRSVQPRARTPNQEEWAKGVMELRKRVQIPNEDGQGSHNMTHEEIVQAFQFVYTVNRFWSTERIITSPATLLEHLTRKRKPTFREAFIDWLANPEGNIYETHHRSNQARPNPQQVTQNALRAAFDELNIGLCSNT
jgi:hypothetical protein